MTDTPPPQAVDYSGRPLRVGDTVAYIGTDPVRLCEGRIAVVSPRNICVESGPHLITFTGYPAPFNTPAPRPLDGAVTANEKRQPLGYPQVALTSTENRFSANLYLGNTEIGAAVQADIERHMNYITRAQGGGA
jgi:hypothetical protein